jgi:putative transposase
MIKRRYSKEQVIKAIKQHESGAKVDNICRNMGILQGTFYDWRSRYAGLKMSEAKP